MVDNTPEKMRPEITRPEKTEPEATKPETARDAAAPAEAIPAVAGTGSPAQKAPEQAAMPPKMSKGEKLYTWSVYSGLNYWLNLASSVVIADYFCNLKGKDVLNKGAEKLGKAIASSKLVGYDKAFKNSQTALKTLTLLSGGWLLIIPIKMLEDNKRPMVHWLNKKLGVDQTGPDGREMKPDEIYIECEQPKQSWLNVIMRRTLATLAVVGTGHAVNAAFRDREKSKTFTGEDDPHGGKAVVERFVVDNVNKVMKSGYVPGGKAFVDNARAQRYLGLAALDTVFTKITAVIMKITNGAKKAQMPHEIGDDAARSASDQSIDQIRFVPQEYEDLRKAQAREGGHADRIRKEQAATAPGRRPAEKAESFTAMAEKRDASPSLAV